MHNIKDIRDNIDNFEKQIQLRNVKIDKEKIINLDKKNRELIQKKEILEKEKKEISKSKDKSLFEKSKKLSLEILDFEKKQKKIKSELDNILSNIPNIPHKDVPIGKDENENVEISKSGKIPNFDLLIN